MQAGYCMPDLVSTGSQGWIRPSVPVVYLIVQKWLPLWSRDIYPDGMRVRESSLALAAAHQRLSFVHRSWGVPENGLVLAIRLRNAVIIIMLLHHN